MDVRRVTRDAELLSTRRAWSALDGWEFVQEFPATRGNAVHTVSRKDDEYRCTCADFVYHKSTCKHIAAAGGRRIATVEVRVAEPKLVVDEGDLAAALQASLAAPETLWIPVCWDWLLKNEMPTPCKAGPSRGADDPNPYTNDLRQVVTRVRGYEVVARLQSGPTNYWLDWLVRQGAKTLYEGTADGSAGEVDFDVPARGVTLEWPDRRLEVDVQRFGTNKKPRRRRSN